MTVPDVIRPTLAIRAVRPYALTLAVRSRPEETRIDKQWYALFTKPHMERRVGVALSGKGHEVYVPLLEYHGKRGTLLTKPFFPRYVFARFDWDTEAGKVRWTEGLTSLVMFGGQPAVVPGDLIEGIKDELAVLDGDSFLRPKPGDRVRITSGPMKDMQAVFDVQLGAKGRVLVLLEILGRETRVEIHERRIDPVR